MVRLLLLLAACSSHAKVVEDAHVVQKPIDAAPPVQKPVGPYRTEKGPVGDVQVRVEWHDVPLAARASSGRDACGAPVVPAVVPTTTWGIPDAFVAIAIDHGKPLVDPAARLAVDRCRATPRALVAGTTLAVTSTADAPVQATLAPAGHLPFGEAKPGAAIPIALPIAGHEVAATLAAGGIYHVEPDAWIIAADTPYVAVTEASGQATLRDVPVGTFAVLAWLPARGGQPARVAKGQVTVGDGVLAEVTLDLTK